MRPILAACIVAFILFPVCAFAGAWTQAQGSGQAILTTSYYNTDSFWDNQGHKQSQPTYSQFGLNPYLEYGLTSDITVGTNLYLVRDHQNGGSGSASQTSWGLGDSEFFLRKRLWQQDGWAVSAQPMLKLPALTDTAPKLGGSSPDVGMGLSAGYGFTLFGFNDYADIDAQYRYRFGTPKDQINLAGTLGISVSPSWMIMPQAFLTYRASRPNQALFTNSSADDYNLAKLQLSVVYRMNKDTSLQAGAFSNIAGHNIGGGQGGFVSVWKNF